MTKFNFGFGHDPEVVGLDRDVAKTRQHSDSKSKKEENLKKEEGEMFGNPYSGNDYNVPGHEDEYLLANERRGAEFNTKKFVPIEEAPESSLAGSAEDDDEDVDPDFENRDLSPGARLEAKERAYDPEADFKNRARKKLDKTEYNALFSFFDSIEKNGTRQDYVGGKDERGIFVPPARSMPRDIINLIKKVNSGGVKMVGSLENVYNEAGNLVDEKLKEVPTDSIKFKAPENPNKTLKKTH